MILNDEERQLESVKDFVHQREGLDCRCYKPNYLKRRLAVRMRATNILTYRDYLALLRSDPEEYDRLLDRLTINVSHFFRDPETFKAISRLVIPALAAKNKKRIRIWSAGCANGEEPYTLAMLFNDQMPGSRNLILATDIDTACLGRAQEGVYKENSIQEVSTPLRQRYFECRPDGWAIDPSLKSGISFARLDLTGPMPTGLFDLIVCRNVMIYFNRQLQERLLREFHRLLYPEGFLVLGKTEVLLAECRGLYHTIDVGERIYQYRRLDNPSTGLGARE